MTHRGSTFLIAFALAAALHAQSTDEYKVKAAVLYNLVKFVEWPPRTFKSATDPIVIGIMGKNPFGDALQVEAEGKRYENRPFLVRQLTEIQQAASCQILFVSSSERKRFAELLSQIQASGVLTVGEADNSAAEGGIVNFKIEGGTVHLQINAEAARRQQLDISAKLLSLAEIIRR